MTEESPSGSRSRIDAAEVNWVDITDDGRRLCLRLVDGAGRPVSVTLPVGSLNTVLTNVLQAGGDAAVPAPGRVHTLDGWSLGRGEQGLLLTLHLPDGAAITFAVKPWQIAAMASLIGHEAGPSRRLN